MIFPLSFVTFLSLAVTQISCQWMKLTDLSLGSLSPFIPPPSPQVPGNFVIVGGQRIEITRDRANALSYGGDYVRKDETPWLCPIFEEIDLGRLDYLCGSSLISTIFVVTAAHCVQRKSQPQPLYEPSVNVICGVHDLTKLSDSNAQRVVAKRIRVHPKWDIATRRYDADIALIELTLPMRLSRFINRIALPPVELVRPGTEGFVVGYGESETEPQHEKKPRRIQIPTVDLEKCYQNHQAFSVIKSEDSFCAGRSGVAPCNGDSGSSYYINHRSTPTIVGVVSVSIEGDNRKCSDKIFSLFVDVSRYVDWITETVGEGFERGGERAGQTDDESEEEDTAASGVWRANEAFCEYIDKGGYYCSLRNVRSSASNVKITRVSGEHLETHDDGDVEKVWIIDQQALYIPEMSTLVKKFTRVKDLRIWNCGLKFIERRKLAIFTRVRVLDFYQNHIETIPHDAFDDMPQLVELKILNNRVRSLPANLFKNLRNLVYFYAEYNELEELPEHLFDGTNIAVVNLKGNQLKRIAVDFRKLTNINNVDLDGNVCINKCMGHHCGKMTVDTLQREIALKCQGEAM